MVKSIRMQMHEMLRKKTVVCTFFILLAFVMVNYDSNLNRYAEIQYVTQMQDPIKLLTLSTWSPRGYFLKGAAPSAGRAAEAFRLIGKDLYVDKQAKSVSQRSRQLHRDDSDYRQGRNHRQHHHAG